MIQNKWRDGQERKEEGQVKVNCKNGLPLVVNQDFSTDLSNSCKSHRGEKEIGGKISTDLEMIERSNQDLLLLLPEGGTVSQCTPSVQRV